jgi:DNA-3-methyladenine glycosylase II
LWARPASFETLVKIILEQQVSLASAASMFTRLQRNIFPFTPARFLELDSPQLRSLGLTRQKASYCLHLSHSLHNGDIRLRQLTRLSDDEAKAALMKLKGIGSWSADVYLLMVLLRPDIWPASDLALAIAVRDLRGSKDVPRLSEMQELGIKWRPYRSVAARMLWQFYLANRAAKRKTT